MSVHVRTPCGGPRLPCAASSDSGRPGRSPPLGVLTPRRGRCWGDASGCQQGGAAPGCTPHLSLSAAFIRGTTLPSLMKWGRVGLPSPRGCGQAAVGSVQMCVPRIPGEAPWDPRGTVQDLKLPFGWRPLGPSHLIPCG